jgi:hypothetical protein
MAGVREIIQADDRDMTYSPFLGKNMYPLATFAFLVKTVQVLLSTEKCTYHRLGDTAYRAINDIARLQYGRVLDDTLAAGAKEMLHSTDHGLLLRGRQRVPACGIISSTSENIHVNSFRQLAGP